jgi:hypothetical protein
MILRIRRIEREEEEDDDQLRLPWDVSQFTRSSQISELTVFFLPAPHFRSSDVM